MKSRFAIDDDGTVTGTAGTLISTSEAYSVSGLYGAAVGKIGLSNLVSLNGRIGLYLWDVDGEASLTDSVGLFGDVSESASDDGEDIFYGVGLNIVG